MEVLLDSNFIISCLRRKIDFLSELEELGFKVMVPKEVLQELKDLKFKLSHADKALVEVAFQLFELEDVKKTRLSNNGPIDAGLIEKGKEGFYIASLDSAIRRSVPNRVIINNAANRIEIERD